MTPTEAASVLNAALDADLPVFLWGSVGIGKSDLVRQVGAHRTLPVNDLRAILLDPVDLRGLPAVQNGKAVWHPMGALPDASRDGPEGILFLDELNAAPAMVQAACFGLVLDRRLGEYELPPGWRVVAAGNRQSDRAAAQRMPSALANRFLHVEVEPDLDVWCKWAVGAQMPTPLIAFIRFRPILLHDFKPDRIINPTPRTWAMTARIITAGLDPETEIAALTGTVGEGPAAELSAFLRVWRKLPSPDGVFLDPNGAAVPDDPATMFALMGALARRVSDQTMDAFVTYLNRVPPEFGAAAMKDAVTRDKTLQQTTGFITWASLNSDVLV